MSTALDIIQGGLLNLNAYSPGQPLAPNIASVGLTALNDLLDSLSTDQAFVFTQNENVVAWTPGQYKYTVGNPTGGTFTGFTAIGSTTITGVTSTVPITFGFTGTAGVYLGGNLTDTANAIDPTSTLVSYDPIGQTVTMTVPALATTAVLDSITYTNPGNFSFPRPLRIRSGYTRVTGGVAQGLDYHFEVYQSLERYNEIGFKGVRGPWPYQACWQPTFPYGTLWVYPNPSIAGEVHLFTDYLLQEFANLTQQINLPQGYARALKKLLGLELAPIFGKTPSPQLINQAKEAKGMLMDLNTSPVTALRYDSDLIYSRHTDASFILDGGFR
jgi:hypothetical protein